MTESPLNAMARRPDIFVVEDDRRIFGTGVTTLFFGILFGLWVQTLPLEKIWNPVSDPISDYVDITIAKPPARREPEVIMEKGLRPPGFHVPRPSGRRTSGDIREKVKSTTLIALLNGTIRHPKIAGEASLPSIFFKDIDQVLANINHLTLSGKTTVGRMGIPVKDFIPGSVGEGGGGIDDLISGLAGLPSGISGLLHEPHFAGMPAVPAIPHLGNGLNGRSPQEIYAAVMRHVGGLRHAYNKRLRVKTDLKGKITVRFTIAPSGKVLACSLVESTLRDVVLETIVLEKIRSWNFDPCDRCGMAQVTYPFAFSK